MESLNDLFSTFKLSETEINKLSNVVKADVINCGGKQEYKELRFDIWDLFDDLSDKLWTSTIPNAKKIALGFQLFEIFPNYFHFLRPFYHLICHNEITDPKEKEVIWKQFMNYLVAEKYYADPVAYVLWVEFFEDSSTVRETWNGLVNNYSDKNSILSLLEVAGPVPFDLKETVYNNLLDDQKNHDHILKSLLFSAYDVFGKIDKKKTLNLLPKLKVDTNTENYRLLMERLK